jgi:hypothetical protein
MQSDKGLRAFLTNFFRSINMAAKDRMAVLSAMMDQSGHSGVLSPGC